MTVIETLAALRPDYDCVVVGAGPAGMAAAAEAAGHGLSTLLVDEAATPGGQIYRAITETPLTDRAVLGADYWRGAALVEAFRRGGADYLAGASVWHLDAQLNLALSLGGRSATLRARQVILATGAVERPFPVKGWTLPGVMSVGAAQTLLKSSGLLAEGRVVIAGTGPLLWLLASQYVAAGRPPSLILDTTPAANWRAAASRLPGFLASLYFRKGLRLMARVRRAVPVVSGVTAIEIEGEADHASAVLYRRGGRTHRVAADHVLLHQGVTPNVNLAGAVGCALRWDEAQACFVPDTDGWGRSSLPGITVAGDGAGIGGAETAALRGRLAGLAAAAALDRIDAARRDGMAAPVRADLARAGRGRAFLDHLYRPAGHFRRAHDEALACRCEEVTGQQLRDTAALGVPGPNQMKALLRCGMGPCQGRLCGLTVVETIAAARGVSPAEVGYYHLRSPVKPVTVAEFAAMPASEAERKAVVRG
ncbi:FAD/NAD(P)-dependent oxidoreductase [Roseomonas elaeocarpi]|uniref:NAD(P)/FAD-dependent oxidoreductase n=1 Tax=Roseomonas elaeocarpi TaxID=907779 RepID=A0ABV6JPT2_9PROT